MKANIDDDDDDDNRDGVSGRQACVLEKPPTFTPACRVAYRALLFLSEYLLYPSPSVSMEYRVGGAKPQVDSREGTKSPPPLPLCTDSRANVTSSS